MSNLVKIGLAVLLPLAAQSFRACGERNQHRLRVRLDPRRKFHDGQFASGTGRDGPVATRQASGIQLALYSRKGESPQHLVNVPAFLLARTEATQELWRGLAKLAGLPEAPSFFKNADDRRAVEQSRGMM